MPIDIAVVPVAGHGTRLLPATKSQPKEMLPVGRKPVVQYVVEELAAAGIRRLLFVTGARKAAIENHFDEDHELISYLRESGREDELAELDFERQEMEYFYTRQRRQLGLGHAVLCARPLIGSQPFVVALGDSIIGLHAKSGIVGRMLEEIDRTKADVVVAFEEVPAADVVKYGIAEPRGPIGDRFELARVVEKPTANEAPSTLAVAGRYIFSPAIFDELAATRPGKGGEIQLTDAIQRVLDSGGKGVGLRLAANERRFDIGNFQSYFRAFVDFALADPKYGKALRAHVQAALEGGPDMRIIRQPAFARAGLVGNPSDGYHGKTISILVRNFRADVTLHEWERIELLLSQDDHSRFDSIDDLVQDVNLHGYYGGIRLIKATIKRFAEFCALQREAGQPEYKLSDAKFSIRYKSNIPRQVGLAGSSAIIVATLRALMEFYDVQIPQRVLPSLALSVEKDELGIGAGLQDRVIQVYEGVVYMDFARESMSKEHGFDCGRYESLDPASLPPLYLAYTRDQAEPGEFFHNPLRERYDRGEPDVVKAMSEVANYAAMAREAILQGNAERLAELIDKNFDVRRRICPHQLHPDHVRMIETARNVGASANYCGSGGAIVGTYRDEETFLALERELGKINCAVLKPRIA